HSHVGTTPAEIAAQSFFHLLTCGVRMLIKKRFASHHEPRCAESALLGIMIDKSCHHGMELPIPRYPFDRLDILTLRLNGQHGARIHRFAVYDHGAGAASG